MNKESCPGNNPNTVNYIFPWDTEPEDRTQPCKNSTQLPEYSRDPIESVAYIGQLIELYINNPNNLHRDSLKEIVREHPIRVYNVGFYEASAQGDRPCIYIKYAGMKSQQDFAFNNSTDYNVHNAVEQFYCEWTLGFAVYVIGNHYTESLAFAEEVRRFLHYYQLPIKRSLCWKKLQVIEVQAPAHDENFDCFTSTINLTALFGDSWKIQEMAPLLKKATFNTAVL